MAIKNAAADFARQTLIQLAKKGVPPTPANYTTTYNEIAGMKAIDAPSVNNVLQKVLMSASHKNPKFAANEKAINQAIKKHDWVALETQFRKLFVSNASSDGSDVNWSVLIRTLLKQLETSHRGMTLSRKKEGLSRVLVNFSKDPAMLADKIQALMRAWGDAKNSKADAIETAAEVREDTSVSAAKEHTSNNTEQATEMAALYRDMLIRTIDLSLIPTLETSPATHKKAINLLSQIRKAKTKSTLDKHAQELKGILLAAETEREEQENINESLIDILRLTSSSMSEVLQGDQWLSSQIKIVNDILSKPVTSTNLQNAESSLKELIHKQSNLKPAMNDAKELLKEMAGTFINRLVDITESTDDYHQKIELHQESLSSIDDIDELNGVLQNVLDDTRTIGLTVQRTREEFQESQDKINNAEKKIQELTSVLEYINEVANEDYLTGTLNRRGMDEALEREFSRADRHNTELCVAMMDIDHFKKLNDSLGHNTGDEALAHFAKVIKDVKRSTDVLARYGGEEFIIILPNTEQNDGIKVVERVQRELTKQFFMHSDERVVITFSAGVAQRFEDETPDSIIPRADAALYEAKSSGRNRVVGATEHAEDIPIPPKSETAADTDELRH